MARLEHLTAPAVEPLGLAETKLHLRLDGDDEDALVLALIKAARECAEAETRRALIRRDFRLWLDAWPAGRRAVELPLPPLAAISEVTLYDAEGVASPFGAGAWLADIVGEPGRLVLRAGTPPPVPEREANGIAVRFTAGYGPAAGDVPEALRRGMALLVGHLFESREAGAAGTVEQLPFGVAALWAPFRRLKL